MSESPDELALLLARARGDGAGPARLARVRARLESQIGPLDAPTSTPAPTSTLGVKVGLGVLAVLAAVALVAWLGATRVTTPEGERSVASTAPERAEPDVSAGTAPISVPPTAPAPEAGPGPTDSETTALPTADDRADDHAAPRRVARRAPVAIDPPADSRSTADSTADPRSTLREEIALLDRALRAREAGDLARASAALDEHRARFPSGTLSPERDRMLAELGRVPPARDPSTEPVVPTAPNAP